MPKKHIDGIERFGPDGKRNPLHRLWLAIRNRCNNPRTPDYKHYGARGIEVCDRWDSFAIFVADVGPHPGAGWTLDRIDNDGDYEPDNVRWATRKTQSRNRGYVVVGEATARAIRKAYGPYRSGARAPKGVSQEQLAQQYGVSQATVSQILRGVIWK